MRVEALDKMVRRTEGRAEAFSDPNASLAIKNFLAVIDGDDSLFRAIQPPEAWNEKKSEGLYAHVGEIAVRFRPPELGRDRKLYFQLIQKLIALLQNAGSRETLEAKLWLASTISVNAKEKEHELWLQLTAMGETPDQAVLRWGLGLAHIQQALLFASRYLRQQLAQTGKGEL